MTPTVRAGARRNTHTTSPITSTPAARSRARSGWSIGTPGRRDADGGSRLERQGGVGVGDPHGAERFGRAHVVAVRARLDEGDGVALGAGAGDDGAAAATQAVDEQRRGHAPKPPAS